MPAQAADTVRANDQTGAERHAGETPAHSQPDATPDDIWATREGWTGSERVGRAVSVYSGSTWALGSTLTESGWRFRSISGHGRSAYPGVMWIGGHAYPVTVHASTGFADLLLGYQWGTSTVAGKLTVKAFAGGSMEYQKVSPRNAVGARSLDYGAKGALETWLDISDRAWVSVDGSLGSDRRAFNSRARFGWRVLPGLSMGPEAGAGGADGTGSIRGGAFARFEWGAGDWWSGEVSAAGGATTAKLDRDFKPGEGASAAKGDPYANVNLLLRY
jgi:Cellulose biosynthesis protein BcsS